MSDRIYILSHRHARKGWQPWKEEASNEGYLDPFNARFWRSVDSGKAALRLILEQLNLGIGDEILITNSSGQTYISSCVTCTVFNHCKPSRELSDRCRAIIVIHEYGVPNPKMKTLAIEAREREIPLIEDCAHTWDSKIDGQAVGTFGDFAMFSLPKIFPVAGGGILSATEEWAERLRLDETVPENPVTRQDCQEFGPYLAWFSKRRRILLRALTENLSEYSTFFADDPSITPIFGGFIVPDAFKMRTAAASIEFGATLRDELLLVPTNPLVDERTLIDRTHEAIARHAAS